MLQVTPLLCAQEDGQLTFLPVSKPKSSQGPDLNEIFRAPVRQHRLLPEAFEDKCRICEAHMKRVPCNLWGKHQPHATFHCEECNLFLFIFTAIPKDLLLWSDRWSGAIDELLAKRAQKEQRRKIRHGESD